MSIYNAAGINAYISFVWIRPLGLLYDTKNKAEALALFKSMSRDDPVVNKWIDFIEDH